MRRIYRYLSYLQTKQSLNINIQPAIWNLNIQMLVRELRRRECDIQKRWQRRFFLIRESLPGATQGARSYERKAWAACFQILNSHNHFRRQSEPDDSLPQAWQHFIWRGLHLNRRKTVAYPHIAWLIAFQVMLSDRLRARAYGWDKAISRIIQKQRLF